MTPFPSTQIPAWRANAKAGVSLADAAQTEVRSPKSEVQSPQAKPEPKLLPVLRATARDRWMASTLAYYTPTIIENTARAAMSGNLIAQWQMFDLMEQTWPRLSKNLNEIKNGAKNLARIVSPFADKDEKPTAEAVRRAKIVDKLLRTMRPDVKKHERDLDDTIYDVLDALGKGIEISEILWEQRNVRIGAETLYLWCPKATRWTHPRYYGYPPTSDFEDALMLNTRELAQVNPGFQPAGPAWIEIPEDQFIVSIIQQKTGHPLNSSLLRILGFWWAAQNFTWQWFLNFAQIFGAPIRWATYDPANATAGTIQNILDMLENMGSMGYGAFPAGTMLELKEAVKSAADNPQKALLDASDLICDLMILGQTLTSQSSRGGEGGGGNRALGMVHQDIRSERIQTAANAGAKTLSEQLIRAICRLNFNDDTECPQLLIVTKANKDLLVQAQRYQILLQTPGVEVSKQQFYEDNELTAPDENDDVIVGGQNSGAGSQKPGEETDPADVAQARAKAAQNKLVENILEDLTGVEARWLGSVKPYFHSLIAMSQSGRVTDEQFLTALAKSQKEMPELFGMLDKKALADSFERAMAASLVNGVARGYMNRGGAR